MSLKIKISEDLIEFINNCPTSFHTVNYIKSLLKEQGFEELKLKDKWNLSLSKKFFINIFDSACFAFIVKDENVEDKGFKIIGAHTDSPAFRIKPNPEIIENGYCKINTEPYGGPILNTWLDRPLSIAGRVVVRSKDSFNPKRYFVDFKRPLLIIPNIAIHFNRKVNEGIKLNCQKDLLPIIGLINEELSNNDFLFEQLANNLNIEKNSIIDYDLFLYECEKGTLFGLNHEFISSSRLDDLAMVHAGVQALISTTPNTGINILACFDNEEIGSRTKQGADSPLLKMILERICLSLGKDKEDFYRSIAKSFLISADMAHAVHPNSAEMSDLTSRPKINNGPVIKINANHNYATDSCSSHIIEKICLDQKIPYQKFANRSDQRGGSTIGPIIATHLNIPTVDIGNPMLAMHSLRETAGVDDQTYIIELFKEFYSL